MKQSVWGSPFFTIVFGIATMLFFALVYPHHLHFQEQYQLFLYDVSYFKEVLSVPGGLAILTGRFFTQFFLSSWGGAAIMALLFVSILLLLNRYAKLGSLQGLVMVPAILLMVFFCDENAMLCSLFAIIFTLLVQWRLSAIGHKGIRLTLLMVSVPVLYWGVGPIAILAYLLHLVAAARSRQQLDVWVAILSIAATALMPVCAHHCVSLPLDQLFYGCYYYRYPLVVPTLLWSAVASFVAVALVPRIESRPWVTLSGWILLSAAGGVTIAKSADISKEEILAYDFMARYQQWNRILKTAQKKLPNNSVGCTTVNLALGMKGMLIEHMFEYNQNGMEGLLPAFVRDPASPLATSEAFYQLGMIYSAQHYVFESQEAIPDFQKSGRCYKRLAETNLILGNYAVARKYLNTLSKTLLYHRWAQKTLALVGNEEAINSHPEYGRLRKMMHKDNIWFSENEMPQMLGQLFISNHSNRMSYEYLTASYLLQRDLDTFAYCLDLGRANGYIQLPAIFQQALILLWSRNHSADEPYPQGINPNIISGMKQFYAMVNNKSIDQSQIKARFGKTYWYYYFY